MGILFCIVEMSHGPTSSTEWDAGSQVAIGSLLEAVTQGVEWVMTDRGRPVALWKHEREPVDPTLIALDWLTIQHTMWNYVGLVRTAKRLTRAWRDLGTALRVFGPKPALWSPDQMVRVIAGNDAMAAGPMLMA